MTCTFIILMPFPHQPLFKVSLKGGCRTQASLYCRRQNKLKSVVLDAFFPGTIMVVPSLLTLVLTLDVYDSHINSRTIDLYLDGKLTKFNFRVYSRLLHSSTNLLS